MVDRLCQAPDNSPDKRQHCIIWARKVDGERVRFHCSTKEECERAVPQYQERADRADANGWKEM